MQNNIETWQIELDDINSNHQWRSLQRLHYLNIKSNHDPNHNHGTNLSFSTSYRVLSIFVFFFVGLHWKPQEMLQLKAHFVRCNIGQNRRLPVVIQCLPKSMNAKS